jgi:hypoxanthine phosphoribosyltransferase
MTRSSNLKLLKSAEEIENAIERLAEQINKDFKDSTPLLIGVLRGTFIFMADLVRKLTIEVEIDFIELHSYEEGTERSKHVQTIQGLNTNVKNRDIIIIEDIVDTGHTINSLVSKLKQNNPSSIKVCALTSKPSRRVVKVKIDYLGFEVPNVFLIGYGLDFNQKYRNLPELYYLEV